ncbi:hypothetical protein U1Q18_007432 [Sarracenia purpurea var. burkii]
MMSGDNQAMICDVMRSNSGAGEGTLYHGLWSTGGEVDCGDTEAEAWRGHCIVEEKRIKATVGLVQLGSQCV